MRYFTFTFVQSIFPTMIFFIKSYNCTINFWKWGQNRNLENNRYCNHTTFYQIKPDVVRNSFCSYGFETFASVSLSELSSGFLSLSWISTLRSEIMSWKSICATVWDSFGKLFFYLCFGWISRLHLHKKNSESSLQVAVRSHFKCIYES